MYLITYINAIDSLARVYDGFFIHGRGTAGAPLDGSSFLRGGGDVETRLRDAPAERIREDSRVPVLVLQSETDVWSLGGGRPKQPDSERLCLWEIAGTAHADTYLLVAGPQDDGRLTPDRLAELLRPTTHLLMGDTDSPINAGPQQHYVGHAALEALDRWSRGGVAPPSAPRLEIARDGRGFTLDENGNVIGGVRTPWVDAPAAVLSGLGQSGGVFGFLFGTTKPFDTAQLSRLYPGGKRDYLARFLSALDNAIAKGFLVAEDREEIAAVAAASFSA
jgi:alpha/beta hydrolase family protein